MDDDFAPKGVPSVTYVRVLPAARDIKSGMTENDIFIDGNAVTVTGQSDVGQPTTRHEVGEVLEPTLNDQDVCENVCGNQAGEGYGETLNPVSALVFDSANCTMFVMGSKMCKKSLFFKKTFLPFIANELFGSISDKDQSLGNRSYHFDVSLSAFELQDEVIIDLLRPATRGLTVSVHPENGLYIPGLHREPTRDELTLRKQFLYACDNRSTHMMAPGASIDTSAAIFEVHLTQTESSPPDQNGDQDIRVSHCKMLLVDLPCVDGLIRGKDLNLLSSPTLHKSLIAFIDVVRKLSTPAKAALAPFRCSKLTYYLSELLGGNSIVVGLGLICPGEPQNTRSTLAIVGALSRAVHYPISAKEQTDVLQGLLCKYRSLILQLQDEIDNGPPLTSADAPRLVTEKMVIQLQQELAKTVLDKNTALADTARLYEMLELLKAKYKTLVEENKQRSLEFVDNENSKNDIADSLLKLKSDYEKLSVTLDNTKETMHDEIEKRDLKISEFEGEVASLNATSSALKEKIIELRKETGDLQNSLSAANATIFELRNQLALENERNTEMSSEVVTLINQKELLNLTCKDLQGKCDQDKAKLESLSASIKDNETIMNEYKTYIQDIEEKLLNARKAEGESDLELKRIKLDIEQNKLDYERSAADFLRSKDDAYTKAKKMAESEILALEKSRENLALQLQRQERKARDNELELLRVKDDLVLQNKEKEALENDLNEIRTQYRRQLSNMIQEEDTFGSRASSAVPDSGITPRRSTMTGGNIPGAIRSLKGMHSNDENVQALIMTYDAVESKATQELKRLQALVGKLRVQYRSLFDKHRSAVDYIEDKIPNSDDIRLQFAEEERLMSSIEKEVTRDRKRGFSGDQYDDVDKDEKGSIETRLREDVRKLEVVLTEEQEKAAVLIASYKKHLERSEKLIADQKHEIASLHVNIKQLVDHSEEWKVQAAYHYKEKLRKFVDQMKKEQAEKEKLSEETQRLQGLLSDDPDAVSQAAEFSLMNIGASGAPETAMVAPAAHEEEFSVPMEIRHKTKHKSKNELVNQISELENRNAELTTANVSMMEELKHYKSYMHETVANYKKQIMDLKTKINLLQQQNYLQESIHNRKPESMKTNDLKSLKFPII